MTTAALPLTGPFPLRRIVSAPQSRAVGSLVRRAGVELRSVLRSFADPMPGQGAGTAVTRFPAHHH